MQEADIIVIRPCTGGKLTERVGGWVGGVWDGRVGGKGGNKERRKGVL